MNEQIWAAEQFEQHRPHLRAVAYRMLGTLAEADDAVQESWLRFSRADTSGVGNLGGWLTVVVGRVCLDLLRARRARREEPLETRLPEPLVSAGDEVSPEQEVLLADSVGLALLVVLETLTPAERLAFVLHDLFAVPFDEIAPVVGRSPDATRQLASRARRRVRGAAPVPDADVRRQRELVDAFLAASRAGDFDALVELLDPDVVFRAVRGPSGETLRPAVHGAEPVARTLLARGSRFAPLGRPALVNGAAGIVVGPDSRPIAIVSFSVVGGKIATIDLVANPGPLHRF